MWTYNESGYLVYIKARPEDTCRYCGSSFERSACAGYDPEGGADKCPKCGTVLNKYGSDIVIRNRLKMGATA